MDFFNPVVNFKGAVECETAPTANNHMVRKQDVSSLSFINGIASGSSSMLSVSGGELSINSLAITDVHVDNSQTTLANFVSNESSTAASLKEGDVLILTAPSDGTETYIISGADGSVVGNYTQIESPLTAAEVGSVLVAGDGVSVNAANATISANIAAGSGLSSSVNSGQITFAFSGNSDIVAEGSSNQYFTQARARGSVQADGAAGNLLTYTSGTGNLAVSTASVRGVISGGAGLTYNSGTGAMSFSGDSDVVAEGSTNKYYTDARSRAAISGGTGISYNSGTGALAISLTGGAAIGVSGNTISFNGDTSDVAEGSNQYFTQARARGSVQADPASGNLLSYTSGSGDLLVSTASVRGVLSAGTGIAYNSGTGAISVNATTSNIPEGSNQYYTDARVRGAIGAGSSADELIVYNAGNGSFSLELQALRFEAQSTLTANTAQTITHNLGKKLVHVSAMDSAGNLVQLDVQYISTSALKVTSAVGVTVDLAVSL
tara:strand:+ start:951 stop:2426 length:1476 start_codon:yes stop_codon:yes gene_type:complete